METSLQSKLVRYDTSRHVCSFNSFLNHYDEAPLFVCFLIYRINEKHSFFGNFIHKLKLSFQKLGYIIIYNFLYIVIPT